MDSPPDQPRRPSPWVSVGIGVTALLAFLTGTDALDRLQNHQYPAAAGWAFVAFLMAFLCVALVRRRRDDACD
jgi:hypothetical protein